MSLHSTACCTGAQRKQNLRAAWAPPSALIGSSGPTRLRTAHWSRPTCPASSRCTEWSLPCIRPTNSRIQTSITAVWEPWFQRCLLSDFKHSTSYLGNNQRNHGDCNNLCMKNVRTPYVPFSQNYNTFKRLLVTSALGITDNMAVSPVPLTSLVSFFQNTEGDAVNATGEKYAVKKLNQPYGLRN